MEALDTAAAQPRSGVRM